MELRASGRLRIEQVGILGKLLAQLLVKLALAVGELACLGLQALEGVLVVGVGLALLAGKQQEVALELLLLGDEVFEGLGGVRWDGQVACAHQFGEGASAAAFQRKGGLLGLLLVEGELGLEGVGVEVAFGEGGFGFGVWDGSALGS